ncbi:hypothetical protein TASIC1_0003006800 [Trichoderma asperellum]|uniref:Uncharacterized protein n=1 Tax=Trichoderma asperellum TaxID=101201 RepID=A0A6V8QMH8_TRIAP|nr:hypothetical protein TASIC1_0003006800 [Trichoderma asperellum]
MPPYSALLLAAAGLAAAEGLTAMNLGEVLGRGVTAAGLGSSAFGVHAVTGTCGIGETDCDIGSMAAVLLGKFARASLQAAKETVTFAASFACPRELVLQEEEEEVVEEVVVAVVAEAVMEAALPDMWPVMTNACPLAVSAATMATTAMLDKHAQLISSANLVAEVVVAAEALVVTAATTNLHPLATLSRAKDPQPTNAPTQSNPFGGSGGEDNTSNPFPPVTSGDSRPSPTDNGSPFTSNAGPAITSDVGRPTTTAASRPTSTNGANSDAIGSSNFLVGLLAFIPFVL